MRLPGPYGWVWYAGHLSLIFRYYPQVRRIQIAFRWKRKDFVVIPRAVYARRKYESIIPKMFDWRPYVRDHGDVVFGWLEEKKSDKALKNGPQKLMRH